MLAHLINVAGSHGKDQIVVGTCLQQEVFDGIKGREVVTFRSFAADVVCQIFAVNSESICLPGCIYISKDNHISQSQSIGELIPECFGTGISCLLYTSTEYHDRIYISARSIDEIHVQLVMERLGGGGHMNSAGAQLTGCTLEDAKRTIENTLDEMIREGDIK